MNNSFSDVWNCPQAFEFICTKKWEDLQPTDVADIHYCDGCSRNVYLSDTPESFVHNTEIGRCVAIPEQARPQELWLGRGSMEFMQAIREREAQNRNQYKIWWNAVLNLDPSFILALIQKDFPENLEFYIELATNFPEKAEDFLEESAQLLSHAEEKDKFALYLLELGRVDHVIEIVKKHPDNVELRKKVFGELIKREMFAAVLEIAPLFPTTFHHYVFSIVYEILVGRSEIQKALSIYEQYLLNNKDLSGTPKDIILACLASLLLLTKKEPIKEAIAPVFIVTPQPNPEPLKVISRPAMTWSVLDIAIINGKTYALFGSDASTDPYNGDTVTNAVLPLLGIKKMNLPKPDGLPIPPNCHRLRSSWSGAKAIVVPDVQGNSLTSQAIADNLCHAKGLELLGEDGFRMAEFHDGNANNTGTAGWDFWVDASAIDSLKISNIRYWVSINDQRSNPWS